jgi:hypothetical protein
MLKVMRDESASKDRRDEMAKASAPYVHPKLAAVQHTGRDGGPVEIDLSGVPSELLAQFEPLLAALAGPAGRPPEGGAGGDREA